MPGSPSMACNILIFRRFTALFLLLLPFPPLTAAQTVSNITLGSSLAPQLGQATSLVSPSGDFAAGFRPLDSNSSLFLLAVWCTNAPDQAIVWAANRNTPLRSGSKLELTSDGRLVLRDHTGGEVWSSGANTTSVTHASMLDSGNFVLVSAGPGPYAWESFGDPTDTILPSQVLQLGSKLTSRLIETDYSDGRFQLRVQTDGNLVFYTSAALSCPDGIDCKPYDAYWSTDTVGAGERLVFNSTGDIHFSLKNGSSVDLTKAKSYSTREFYHRATLDPDGVLRHYVYPKTGAGGGGRGTEWTVADSLPSDICIRITSSMGSGVCGFNSYCSPDAETQRSNCACPPQYSFVDPGRKYKGCKPNFVPPTCEDDGGGGGSVGEFRIERMRGINWPFSDYDHLQPMDEDQCSDACLNDCFCSVAIHGNDQCWKKRLPLSNGRFDTGATALLKLPRDPTNNRSARPNQPPNPNPPFIMQKKRTWLLVLLGGTSCLMFAVVVLLSCCFCHKKMPTGLQPEPCKLGTNLRPFTYKELEKATQGFKEELGKGAFGVVYKGVVESDSGSTLIAVKRLQDLDEAVEQEFENEVRVIARTHHKNLVRLLGYCNEGPRRLLVYEYMSNGSLLGLLQGSTKPDWNTRVQIAFGVARGLLYLHEECSAPIIHCDIKPQNILIDDRFNPRISDFGLAKLLMTDQTRTKTGIRGTRGYVAPEWFKPIAITSKVDVYSFGVLLLEIICCRKNVELEVSHEEKTVLTYWVYDCFRDERLNVLVESEDEPLADMRRLERLVMVALWCIQEEPSLRPTMEKVTQMLVGAVAVAVPPDPSSYISSID